LYLNELPAKPDFKIGSRSSAQSKMYGEIFNDQGIIRSLQPYQMNIKPNSQKVDHFGRMYTIELVGKLREDKETSNFSWNFIVGLPKTI
jgi:hypothetical protein